MIITLHDGAGTAAYAQACQCYDAAPIYAAGMVSISLSTTWVACTLPPFRRCRCSARSDMALWTQQILTRRKDL